MARRPRRRNWKDARDWVNVAVAACALTVSIVSLWTTTQISGVQDYLQSEIKRRNNDLNGISDQSRRLESIANERANRVSALQVLSDSILASSLEAQRNFSKSQDELSKIRSDVLFSKMELGDAQSRQRALQSEIGAQADNFDLFRRVQAQEYASLSVVMDEAYYEDEAPSGGRMMSSINSLVAPPGQNLLQPYFDRMKNRVAQVCPSLPSWKADLPPKPSAPPKPTISYMSNASKTEIARLTKEAQDRYSKDMNAYFDASKVRLDKQIKASGELHDFARRCMCLALADNKFDSKQVCPK